MVEGLGFMPDFFLQVCLSAETGESSGSAYVTMASTMEY